MPSLPSSDFIEPTGDPLASARAELLQARNENFRRLRDFRLALEIAKMAGLSPDTVCGETGVGDGITVRELERLVQECEAEEVRVSGLIALVDTRIAQGGRGSPGAMH